MQNILKQIQYTFLLGDLSLVPTVPTVKAEDTCNFFNPILQTPSVLQKILAFPSSLTGKTQGRWEVGDSRCSDNPEQPVVVVMMMMSMLSLAPE